MTGARGRSLWSPDPAATDPNTGLPYVQAGDALGHPEHGGRAEYQQPDQHLGRRLQEPDQRDTGPARRDAAYFLARKLGISSG